MTASDAEAIGPVHRGVPADAAHAGDRATPVAWRAGAFALLVGGVAGGLALGRSRIGRLVPVAIAGVAAGSAIPVALASRRPPVSPRDAQAALADSPWPTISVVVAARDEAGVLPDLVGDLARQDYRDPSGRPLFELIVVDDRSTDGTGDVAIETARGCGIGGVTRVVRREGSGLPDGKGAALTAAQPELCGGDVVVVLDGDARIAPHFLRRAAGYFAAGMPAVTARRRIFGAAQSQLAGAQADEQTFDGELQLGRWALGGCSEFRGNGIMLRRDLLASVGGWRARALTEDLDLSSRVAAASGARVAWAVDVEVWEEPVRDWLGLWRQRVRWAEGALRRAFEHTPSVVASRRLPLTAKLDYLTYAGQLGVPAVGVGLGIGALATRRPALILEGAAGYAVASAILGWDSLRWERHDGKPLSRRERGWRTLRVSLFNWLWLAVVPRALWNIAFGRGGVRYVKMEHFGAGTEEM